MVNEYFVYCCLSLACISIICISVMIVAHYKIRELYKHPGELVLTMCLVQFVYNLNWALLVPSVSQ